MTSPSTLDAELAFIVCPTWRILLVAQIPDHNRLLNLRGNVRLWLRWAESEETGEGARIVIAESTPRDEEMRTARVAARATPADRRLAWYMCRFLEFQGLTDLFVGAPAGPNRPPREYVHLLGCADLAQRSARNGLSVDHFPEHYI